MKKISSQMIGYLSDVLADKYTHDGIDLLFLTAVAPDQIPNVSKKNKVNHMLKLINRCCDDPLAVLGEIISEIMETEPQHIRPTWTGTVECTDPIEDIQNRIKKILANDSLQYTRGGHIAGGGGLPTVGLLEAIEGKGLTAIEIEIRRALENVEKDPLTSVHNSGAVLEATLKTYLAKQQVEHNPDKDTLADLWRHTHTHLQISPKKLENENFKKIASGLFNVVEGTIQLRNKKSAAHGKSQEQFADIQISPRHARLAINSAHTLCAYFVELV